MFSVFVHNLGLFSKLVGAPSPSPPRWWWAPGGCDFACFLIGFHNIGLLFRAGERALALATSVVVGPLWVRFCLFYGFVHNIGLFFRAGGCALALATSVVVGPGGCEFACFLIVL